MTRIRMYALVVTMVMIGMGALAMVGWGTVLAQGSGGSGKIGVCHRTGDPANPIVFITVAANTASTHERHGDRVGVGSLAACTVAPTATVAPTCSGPSSVRAVQGITTTTHELGVAGPTSFQLFYDMGEVADRLDVFYEGNPNPIYTTGDFVSDSATVTVNVPAGTATTVTVVVTGPDVGTVAEYTLYCPVQ